MDENKEKTGEETRERRKQKESEKKSDHIARMMITQLLLCAVMTLFVVFAGRTGGGGFLQLKEGYNRLTSRDMSVSQLWQEVRNVVKTVVKKDEIKTTSNLFAKKVNIDEALDDSLGKGGEDQQVFAPTGTTLFSPFLVSSTICTPVSGTISSPFGYRVNPITRAWSFHSGIDIAAGYGEKIKAAYYGTVSSVGYDEAAGNFVIISHSGGLVTKYFHCCEILVSEGANVRKGEAVARVGSTGMSTGPHLHFIIEINGKKVNPLYVLENDGTKV
ncbi:MAG: M23 family metallopeptidase [Clostridia bacterium]|nr:M23 family metallopeptidase [Clostridia bacterium]